MKCKYKYTTTMKKEQFLYVHNTIIYIHIRDIRYSPPNVWFKTSDIRHSRTNANLTQYRSRLNK